MEQLTSTPQGPGWSSGKAGWGGGGEGTGGDDSGGRREKQGFIQKDLPSPQGALQVTRQLAKIPVSGGFRIVSQLLKSIL